MRLTVSETAKLSGVSVRTLHYYDQIGLLKPDAVDEQNGYRYYGETALKQLQQILFYRELDFSLKEIAALLSSPRYNPAEALNRQRRLLTLKKQRLERLIALLDDTLKGEHNMSFAAFENMDYEVLRSQYAQEAKERWGGTEAYAESQRRAAGRTKEQWASLRTEAQEIFRAFSACRGQAADSPEVQALVKRWQDYISVHHYPCTREILAGLGQMYTADSRFQENLDRFGSGTAALMSEAIAAYCQV